MKKDNKQAILHLWEYFNNKMGEPVDDYGRVYRHYIGNMLYVSNRLLRNIISFVLFPFVFTVSFFKSEKNSNQKYDAVITCPNDKYMVREEDFPDDLAKRYNSLKKFFFHSGSLYNEIFSINLDRSGRRIIFHFLKHYPFRFYMVFCVLLNLSRFYRLASIYKPKAFIVTQYEQNFVTSIITRYCEDRDIKFIGIQHGEYCYNPSMAYVRFSEYYAWNKETIEIMQLTNTKIDNAHIYTPGRLKPKLKKKDAPRFFLTYYLSSQSVDDVYKIKELLLTVSKCGFRCNVRRHPRFFSAELMTEVFDNTDISVEDVDIVTVEESMCDCSYLVAYQSTVLSQGYANAMDIVVDDIVGDIRYLEMVHELNLMRSKMKLSDLLKMYNIVFDINSY